MGLLNRILAGGEAFPPPLPSAKKGGLLSRSETVVNARKSSFRRIAGEYRFPHAALLEMTEGSFVMTKCAGIDAETAAKSVSSKDFWRGTLADSGGWRTVLKSSDGFGAFRQFLSEAALEQTAALHFLNISADAIFMAADYGTAQSVPDDVKAFRLSLAAARESGADIPDDGRLRQALDGGLSARMLTVDAGGAVAAALKPYLAPSSPLYGRVRDSVFAELSQTAEDAFIAPNFCVPCGGGKIRIVFFAGKPDGALMTAHLEGLFSAVLGENGRRSLLTADAGSADCVESIKEFIQKG